MADSGSVMGQFSDEMEQVATETVGEVKDAIGEAIEVGVQSVTNTNLTPQQIQQRQQEEQAKIQQARKTINFYQKTEAELKKVREESKQKEAERIKAFEEDMKKKRAEMGQVDQGEKKPGQSLSEEIARTRQESGKGHGVGG